MNVKTTVTIRSAEVGDYLAYCRLFNVVNDLHVAAHPETFRHATVEPRTREDYQALLEDPAQCLLLGIFDGTVAGYVQIIMRERPPIPIMVPGTFAVVDTLVVDAAYRKRGLGRALMAAAEDWARHNGADRVELNVWVFNRDAVRLYEELEYRGISQRMRKTFDA